MKAWAITMKTKNSEKLLEEARREKEEGFSSSENPRNERGRWPNTEYPTSGK